MNGFRLGSVLGFEVRIDYSWFIIFFLILGTLTAGVFPASYPGQDTVTYVAMGLAGTLLFFASLLAHELSHSLVARAKGIPVEGITLFIFGGIAHTRMEFEEPGDEFLIAGVGPLSSFLIGALFYFVSWAGVQAGWPVAVIGVAWYLGFINVVLAVFNLLPGFPLDGGRLFRAAVWKFTGDLRKATRYASMGGKILGYLLILLGVLSFFAGNLIGGLWFVFIGWFVRMAAEASYVQLLLRRSLRGVRAADAMTPDPYTIDRTVSVEEFVDEHIFRGRHQSYPVVDDGRAVGIITLDQVRGVPRDEWRARTVADAMIPVDARVLARPDDPMDGVMERLGQSPARRVLVARDDQLVGIITQSDVARWLERVRLIEGR